MSSARYEDILAKGFDEYQRYVNPLITQRAKLAREPIHLRQTKDGLLVHEKTGQLIEDFHGTQAFGHRNPHIAQTIKDYLESDAPSWYPSRVNPFAGRLARLLSERVDGYYDTSFFACTGADAVEAALKMARALTRRPRILCLDGGYHGCTFGAVSMMSAGYLHDPFGPHLPGVERVPFGDVDALHAAFKGGDVAAVVVEPIQGEGGVRVLPADFVEALGELTERHGALLIADEVQTAMGRTGRGFLGTAQWPRRPDIVCMAKHLGGGLVPISAMMTKQETFMRAYGQDFASGEAHNTTMGFNALSSVAAMAALELLSDELIAQVKAKSERFKAMLHDALKDNPLYREVRGEGMMLGIAFHDTGHPWLSFEHFGYPELADKSVISPLLCHRIYERGFFCFTCGHDWNILRLQPRFEIPTDKLDAFVQICKEELAYIQDLC